MCMQQFVAESRSLAIILYSLEQFLKKMEPILGLDVYGTLL